MRNFQELHTVRSAIFQTWIILLAVVTLASCTVSRKNTDYFQTLKKDSIISNFVNNDFENIIQKGDALSIIASSLSPVEDAIFNQGGSEISNIGAGGNTAAFKVRENGTVLLHRLGSVQAAGLTRRQLSANIQTALAAFMKEPIVAVRIINQKITVLGAVGSPQVIPLAGEQMPLIDALVISGDAQKLSKTDDIMIIREQANNKIVKHVNLQDASIFQSEWYYARPNDIIYVSEDRETQEKEDKQNRLRNVLSLTASGISLIIIILDRVIK